VELDFGSNSVYSRLFFRGEALPSLHPENYFCKSFVKLSANRRNSSADTVSLLADLLSLSERLFFQAFLKKGYTLNGYKLSFLKSLESLGKQGI
jgi:hypothetical protein